MDTLHDSEQATRIAGHTIGINMNAIPPVAVVMRSGANVVSTTGINHKKHSISAVEITRVDKWTGRRMRRSVP